MRRLWIAVIILIGTHFLLPSPALAQPSQGCTFLNGRSGDFTVFVGGISGGGWYPFYFEAGEVITFYADGATDGRAILQVLPAPVTSFPFIEDAVPPMSDVPARITYTIPTSGYYEVWISFTAHVAQTYTWTFYCTSPADPTNEIAGAPVAIFENEYGLGLYWLANSTGEPLLFVSNEQLATIPEFPAENTLIAEADHQTALYRLTTGELQVNVGPNEAGDVYVFIWVPGVIGSGYRRDFNVYTLFENEEAAP